MEKRCGECREPVARLRKGRCDACYMRVYRRGEPAAGARCAACGERRRPLLDLAKIGGVAEVLCGNCALVLSRSRPHIASVDELRRRLAADRVPERRAARMPRPRMPSFDPSLD